MVNDDQLNEALALLNRIHELQWRRTHPELDYEPNDGWHRAEDVLTALMVVDCYDTKAILTDQIRYAEQMRRSLGMPVAGRKLDG